MKNGKGSPKKKVHIVEKLTAEVATAKLELESAAHESKHQLDAATEENVKIEQSLLSLKSAQSVEQEVLALEKRIKADEHEFDKERLGLLAKMQQISSAADVSYRELYERSQVQLAEQLERNKRVEEDHLSTVMRLQQQFDSTKSQLLSAFRATLAKVSEENRALAEQGLTRDVQQKLQKHHELQREVELSRSAARKVLLQLHRVERMYTRVMLETSMWKEKCHLLEARIVELKRKAAGKKPLTTELKDHLRETQFKGSLAHPRFEPLSQSKAEREARLSLETFASVDTADYRAISTSTSSHSPETHTTPLAVHSPGASARRGQLTVNTLPDGSIRYPFGIAQQLATTISESRKVSYSALDENMHVVARLLAETSDMVDDETPGPGLATSLLPNSPLKRQSSARDMDQFTAFAAAHVDAARAASNRADQMGTQLKNAPSDPALALLQSSKASRNKDKIFSESIMHTLPSRSKTGLNGFVTIDAARDTSLPSCMQQTVQRAALHRKDSYLKQTASTKRLRPSSAAPSHNNNTKASTLSGKMASTHRPQSARARAATNHSATHEPSLAYGSSQRPTKRTFGTGRRASGAFKFLLQGNGQTKVTADHNSHAPQTLPNRRVQLNSGTDQLILGTSFHGLDHRK